MKTVAPALFHGAYARLAEVLPAPGAELVAELPEGDGWVRSAELAPGSAAVRRLVDVDAAHGRSAYGTALRPDVAASFCLHRYAWPFALLAGVPWLLERRVPRLPAGDVALRRRDGRWALRIRTFACLPGDPAAGAPGARVVPDEDALRAELRAAVAEHMAPVLDAFRPLLRRGRRTLWGMVTDELAESLWYAGRLMGCEAETVRAVDALLPGGTLPLAGAAAFTRCAEGFTRTRVSCCLYYTVDRDSPCATCPRRLSGGACQRGS